MLLSLLLLVIFFASVAFLYNNGLWSNAVTLINVITAGLLAVNYFEPLANWLDKQASSFTYVWDFLALWFIFAVSMSLMRTLADLLSKVKVKFKRPIDLAGGAFFACWIGWVLVCFTTMTLHTAPLARSFLGESFQPTPDARMFFGRAPDHQWLGFVQKLSTGAYYRGGTKDNPALHKFDPQGDFIFKYAASRKKFESEMDVRTKGTR